MFFGQEVKQNQNKASAVTMESDIHLSQAVLDPASKGNKKEPVCLMAEIEGKSFILAVLDPSQSWQCPLDLNLLAGTEVKFYLRGQGNVHLTGYEYREEDDLEMSLSSSDEDMMEEPEDEANSKHTAKKIKTKGSPGKVKNSPAKTNGVKPSNNSGAKPSAEQSSDDDDDSDDEDLSFGSEDDVGDSDDSDMDDVDLDALSSDDDDDDDEDDENGNNDDDDDDDDDDSDY